MTEAKTAFTAKKPTGKGYATFIKVIQYLVLTIIAIFLAFPFFLLITRSFMSEIDINAARIWRPSSLLTTM